MPIIKLTEPFSRSYSRSESYPLNVILRETYGLSRLTHIRTRLEERTRHLFVNEVNTHIAIKDVDANGVAEKLNLFSDTEIQEWLGISSIEYGKTLIVTKKDPRCRFVSLLADTIFAPLNISTISAFKLMTYHQVSPNFFEFLYVYGSGGGTDREIRFSSFRTEINLANVEPGLALPELGRSGRRYQICYNIKTAAHNELVKKQEPGQSLWQIRQAAIHHQFDVGSGNQLWIFGDPHADLKHRIAENVSDQSNHKDKFGTISASFQSSLGIHLKAANWSTEGWRQYILCLEKALEDLTSRLMLTSGDPLSQLQQDQLHYVQQYEDWINDCIMTLESNVDIMNSLSAFYRSILEDDDFPLPERRTCVKHVKHFNGQLWELIYDVKMQARRAKALQKMMADRRAMCVQLLQAQAADRAVQLSTSMWRQAEQTSHETVAMRIITVITLIYLPPTFVSTLFSTDIVKYQGDDGDLDHDIFSSLALQRFLEFSLPLMLLTFTVAFGWLWYEKIMAKRKAERLAAECPEVFGQAEPKTTPDPSNRAARRRLVEKPI